MHTSIVSTIDTRYGTYNSHAFSNGNTLPLTGVPFGMNYFAPQTSDQTGNWWFNPYEPVYQGIRLTHQPSPWLGDFASLLLTPVTGELSRDSLFHRQSSYQLDQAVFRPDLLQLQSNRYRLVIRLAPSRYGASFEIASFANQPVGIVFYSSGKSIYRLLNPHQLLIQIFQVSACQSPDFCMYALLEFEEEITECYHLVKDRKIAKTEVVGEDLHLRINFSSTSIKGRLATSFISPEQAAFLLKDVPDFPQAQTQAENTWNQLLDRVQIRDKKTEDINFFYHCLYRCLLYPQTFYEPSPDGQAIHFDPISNQAKLGKFFTNNGYWDTFRSSYPLLSLIYPDYLEEFLQAMIETSQKTDADQRYGRHGSQIYRQLNYLPLDFNESVSHSLDYAYSDWAISQVAEKLEQDQLAKQYAQMSLGYRQLFDSQTGLIRAKDRQKQFRTDFSPLSWGRDYAECSALQATLSVFHDIDGLIELMGGKEAFTTYLIQLCNQEAYFSPEQYGYEIHEMSEMAQVNLGQLAISNQPSFHIPYLFQWSTKPEYTSLLIHKIRQTAFKTGFQAYPGDEDNGSLSAWYIFSCLGFYPVCPGKADYQIGLPHFKEVDLLLADQHMLTISTPKSDANFQFVKQVSLDNKVVQTIKHEQLVTAKCLEFDLSILPSIEAYS
ncbi:TPA: GH92 family glycosyl hydrolase [Streptococcus suis]|nr:GH92 family glycosyl hydrolase [Streptococcus suis]